nr:PC4 [Argopecten irradians irradians]
MADIFCVEYANSGGSHDVCIICGAKIGTKGSLKVGYYGKENQEEKQWYHFKCFWQERKFADVLKDEDANFPSFEGFLDLKSNDKRKITSALKAFQKENSSETSHKSNDSQKMVSTDKKYQTESSSKDAGTSRRGIKRSAANKSEAAGSSKVCRLETKTQKQKAKRQGGPTGKHMFRIHEDSMKYLEIKQYKKGVFIILNEYHYIDSDNSWFPTSDGVRLSIREWEDLYKGRTVIDKAIRTAENNDDASAQKERRDIPGLHSSCVGDSVDVVLYLSERRPVCVKTTFENNTKQVDVGIGYNESFTYVDGKASAPYYLPVCLSPEEWANLVQLRPEVNEDLVDSFDTYCVDI